jgi:PAS domain S-box-containing protein
MTVKKASEVYPGTAASDWRIVLDSIKDPIMFLNSKFQILACSKGFVSFLGLPKEKILGNFCFTLVHGTNEPIGLCPIKKMMQTKKHEETELYLDERGMWFSVSVSPSLDEMGNVIGAVHILTDTTSRKQAEYSSKTCETRYQRLFETAMDGILILDAQTGQIDDVNPFLTDMLGYTYEEFQGKKLWKVGAFRDTGASKRMFAESQTKGYVRYEDLPLVTKDGQEIAVEFGATSIGSTTKR